MTSLILFLSLLISFQLHAKPVEKLKDIPTAVVKFCYDSSGRIADVGQPWEISDTGDNKLPRSILVGACQNSSTDWSILCQKGGYASSYHLVRVKKFKLGWKKFSNEQSPNLPAFKCQ